MALALSACGEHQPSVGVPGEATARQGSWRSITQELVCQPPRSCGEDGSFRVQPDGRFQFSPRLDPTTGEAAPSAVHTTVITGVITEDELKDLRPLADAVADQDLGTTEVCTPSVTIPELRSDQLTMSFDSDFVLFSLDTRGSQGLCTRGDRQKTLALKSAMDALYQTYSEPVSE